MAGVSTKDIKQRIRSMESTRQITRAMEMVASSKLRRAQERINDSRPYFEILYSTIARIAATKTDFASPYLTRREGNKVLCIAIAGAGPWPPKWLPRPAKPCVTGSSA